MNPTPEDFVTLDRLGRGYATASEPVRLETPLTSWESSQAKPFEDDGHRPNFWRVLLSKDTWLPPAQVRAPVVAPAQRAHKAPETIVEIVLRVPPDLLVREDRATALLAALRNLTFPISFELIASNSRVEVVVACAVEDSDSVLVHLEGFFPEIAVALRPEQLSATVLGRDDGSFGVIDFGLGEFVFRELASPPKFATDPLIGLIEVLGRVREGEVGLFQVVFEPSRQDWASPYLPALNTIDDTAECRTLALRKFYQPLYAVVMRVGAVTADIDRCDTILRQLGSALIAATRSDLNELIALSNDGYKPTAHLTDVLNRCSRRSGMILSAGELASIVHPPSASVRSKQLERFMPSRTKPLPAIARGCDFVLGINEHEGIERNVTLSRVQRTQHTHIIGASGTGKTTLLISMILQDMEQGAGLAVLDPHGDLIEDILARVPAERSNDVILVDPSDEAFPVGMNPLSAHSELERTLLSSDLVASFRRLSTSWGDQMNAVLANGIAALLESTRPATLLDLRRFLIDQAFRREFLTSVQDPEVVYYWTKEFPLLRGNAQAPILTRLDAFLRPKSVRYMVAQTERTLDFRSIVDDKKILLVKLSEGLIGEENAALLGSLFVAKLHQIAMSRQNQDAHARTPFFMYLDEFHHFITPSLASLLSGARKYALGLTLVHQELEQIAGQSKALLSALLSNPFSRIYFRVGDTDAKRLADGLSFFEASDLQALGRGEAIARIERADYDFNMRTLRVARVPGDADKRRESLRAISRAKHATPRPTVEARLAESHRALSALPAQATEPTPKRRVRVAPPVTEDSLTTAISTPNSASMAAERPFSERVAELSEPLLPGRGGKRHKYLQSMIKQIAESRGYRATLEQPVLSGLGHVDVALKRDTLSIACEISVTTDIHHELKNLEKCLASGFDYVVMLATERERLNDLRDLGLRGAWAEASSRLRYLTPDEMGSFLDTLNAERASLSNTIRGYKVSVKYRAPSDEEKKNAEAMISAAVAKSTRRKPRAK